MLIYAIDGEPNMLRHLHEAIAEAAPEAEIEDFSLASDALKRIGEDAHPDVIFSEIRMPGIPGLELAKKLKLLSPETKLVFVSGHDYELDAYRLHVNGYILKPVEADRIREELDLLFPDQVIQPPPKQLYVRCFGQFEVFWKNEPILFSRKQTKELFAYLVDRRGARCSTDNIVSALCEDLPDINRSRHLVWNLTSDLKATLRAIGMEEVLISRNRQIAIRTNLLNCDYYLALEGNASARSLFFGEYMEQYSWAEVTKAGLIFRSKGW